MKNRRLRSVTQIIQTIDDARGHGRFRELIKHPRFKRGKQSIQNYKAANRLPPDTFLIITAELETLSCTAPSSLWDITEVPKSRAA
jgi:hypothetical protein